MVLEDLIKIKEAEQAKRKKFTLRCCLAAGCMSSNAQAVKDALEKAVKDAGLENELNRFGHGHEIACNFRMRHCQRSAQLKLLAEKRDHAAA